MSNNEQLEQLHTALSAAKGNTYFYLIGENSSISISDLRAKHQNESEHMFGAVFPEVIIGGKSSSEYVDLVKIDTLLQPLVIQNMSDDLSKHISPELIQKVAGSTAIVLVDGLSSYTAEFLENLYQLLGNKVQYIGGGAGSLTLKQGDCLFDKKDFFYNGALVVFLKGKASLGVKHGWEWIKGPLMATKAEKNIVMEINWKPAYEVYKNAVEEDSKEPIIWSDFFSISMNYPLGMISHGDEVIVRDPISVYMGSGLSCVGEVPENSAFGILKGKPEQLIQAAGEAAKQAVNNYTQGNEADFLALFNCISRRLFLAEKFEEELSMICSTVEKSAIKSQRTLGALTLGEIASDKQGFLYFYNKTTVVSLIKN